eukprot:scaffold203838_cov46-Attheya_sp.AAC.2
MTREFSSFLLLNQNNAAMLIDHDDRLGSSCVASGRKPTHVCLAGQKPVVATVPGAWWPYVTRFFPATLFI